MFCECGNDSFKAHQICRHEVLVDEYGNFTDDCDNIYDAETPFGPFTCTKCGKEYEELNKEQ